MDRPQIGETLEAAIWLDGRETEEQLAKFSVDARKHLDEEAENWKIVLGPPYAITKRPGEERVPPVPDHIAGPNVRLLVIEAHVLGNAPKPDGFLEAWDNAALLCARSAIRTGYKVMMMENGLLSQPELTDRQCDTVLSDLGEERALDILRFGDIHPELVERTFN